MAGKSTKKKVQKKLTTKKKVTKKVSKTAVKKVTKKTVKKAVKKVVKKAAKKAVKKLTNKVKTKAIIKPVAKKPVSTLKPKVNIDYSLVVTPLGDRIVTRPEKAGGEKVTAGGLIIPDTVNTVAGYIKAEVLAVGTGVQNKKTGSKKPLDVQVGDFILFSDYAGTKIQFNSEDILIVHESDVMGIVQNSN